MATKLYPPTIGGVLPAFYRTYKADGTLSGATIQVPYSMNNAVSYSDICGFVLKIKTVNTDTIMLSLTTKNYSVDDSIAIFNLTPAQALELNVGQFYKIQMAYAAINTEEAGYFSTVSTIKCVSKPTVSILNQQEKVVNLFSMSYTGLYEQTSTIDFTEKVYSYCFNLYDINDNLVYTTGEQLHNTSNDTSESSSIDSCDIKTTIADNTVYKIEYSVQTVNGLTITSPRYKMISTPAVDFEKDIQIIATSDTDEGYISITFQGESEKVNIFNDLTHMFETFDKEDDYGMLNDTQTGVYELINRITKENKEVLCNGSFLLSRASSKDDYGSWVELERFRLSGETPSSHEFHDYTVEQGIYYKYSIQQYNTKGVYSKRNESEIVFADFEDAYLFDGEQSLRIRFNPKVSSFKNNKLETKIETIGSQYPYIFRNGNVSYKEFPISGLISYQMDLNHRFDSDYSTASSRRRNTNASSSSNAYTEDELYINTDLSGKNFSIERQFKLKVLDWLNNGEIKLFRSPTEGNYLVRLMNVSLTPTDTLGRMLHTFTCTAYEVAEFNYTNLVNYGIIDSSESPELKSMMWQTKVFTTGGSQDTTTGDMPCIPSGAYYSISCENFVPGDIIHIDFTNASYNMDVAIGPSGIYELSFDDPLIECVGLVHSNGGTTTRSVLVSSMGDEVHKFDIISNVTLYTVPFQQFMTQQVFTIDTLTGQFIGRNLINDINVHIGSDEYGTNKVELVKFENLTLHKRHLIPVFKYTINNLTRYYLPFNGFSADSELDLCNSYQYLAEHRGDNTWQSVLDDMSIYLRNSGFLNLFNAGYGEEYSEIDANNVLKSLFTYDATNLFVVLDFEKWQEKFKMSDDYQTIEEALSHLQECIVEYLDPIARRKNDTSSIYYHYNNLANASLDNTAGVEAYGSRAYIAIDNMSPFLLDKQLTAADFDLTSEEKEYCTLTTLTEIAKLLLTEPVYMKYKDCFGKKGAELEKDFPLCKQYNFNNAVLQSEIFRKVMAKYANISFSILSSGTDEWAAAVEEVCLFWTKVIPQLTYKNYNLLDLNEVEEWRIDDCDSIAGIYFENGVYLEGGYQVRVIDYSLEESNSEVAEAKQAYLDAKESLGASMETYSTMQAEYNNSAYNLSEEQNITYLTLLDDSSCEGMSPTIQLLLDQMNNNLDIFSDFIEYLQTTNISNDINISIYDLLNQSLKNFTRTTTILTSDTPVFNEIPVLQLLKAANIVNGDLTSVVWTQEYINKVREYVAKQLKIYYLLSSTQILDPKTKKVQLHCWDSDIDNESYYTKLWTAELDYEEQVGIYNAYLDVINQIKEDVQSLYCYAYNNSVTHLQKETLTELNSLFSDERIKTVDDYKQLAIDISNLDSSFTTYASSLPYLWYLTATITQQEFNVENMKQPSLWNFVSNTYLNASATEYTDQTKKQQLAYYTLIEDVEDCIQGIKDEESEATEESNFFKKIKEKYSTDNINLEASQQREIDKKMILAEVQDIIDLIAILKKINQLCSTSQLSNLKKLWTVDTLNSTDNLYNDYIELTKVLKEKKIFNDTGVRSFLSNNDIFNIYKTMDFDNYQQVVIDTDTFKKIDAVRFTYSNFTNSDLQLLRNATGDEFGAEGFNIDFSITTTDADMAQESINAMYCYIYEYLYNLYQYSTNFHIDKKAGSYQMNTLVQTQLLPSEDNVQQVLGSIYFFNITTIRQFMEVYTKLSSFFTSLYKSISSDITTYTEKLEAANSEVLSIQDLLKETELALADTTLTADELLAQIQLKNDLEKIEKTIQTKQAYYRYKIELGNSAIQFYNYQSTGEDWIPDYFNSNIISQLLDEITEKYDLIDQYIEENIDPLVLLTNNSLITWKKNGTDIYDDDEIYVQDESDWTYATLTYKDSETDEEASDHIYGYTYKDEEYSYQENGGLYDWLTQKIKLLDATEAMSLLLDKETGVTAIIGKNSTTIDQRLEEIRQQRLLFNTIAKTDGPLTTAATNMNFSDLKIDEINKIIKDLRKILDTDPYTEYWENGYVQIENSLLGLWNNFISALDTAYREEIEARYDI